MTRAEFEKLQTTPEWTVYLAQKERLDNLLGKALREKPYDFNGVLIKNGDRVRSTLGLNGFDRREGVARISDDPALPNCIEVDGWTSAASLWEVIEDKEG